MPSDQYRSVVDGYHTISRGSTAVFNQGPLLDGVRRNAYPTNAQVILQAAREGNRRDEFDNVYFPDRLWGFAMVTDRRLEAKTRMDREYRDRPLIAHISDGLYDQKDVGMGLTERRSLKYSAVATSMLYDHILDLEPQVGFPQYLICRY